MALEGPTNTLITLLDVLRLDKRAFAVTDWFRRASGQRTPEDYTAVDGTVNFVRDLSAKYDLAIVTTRSRSDTQRFLEAFDLESCFGAIVTRQDVRRLKPHPESVRSAAEQLGHPPHQCIVVGDTTVDIQAGKRAGALTVGVLCGFGERPELKRLNPDLLLETTSQLGQPLLSEERTWSEP